MIWEVKTDMRNETMKKKFLIKDMHCTSCEKLIENKISKMDGVKSVKVSYADEQMEVDFDENKVQLTDIITAVKDAGYNVIEEGKEKKGFFDKLFGRGGKG